MTAAPWPCWRCGEAGVKNLGVRGYCGRHYSELLGKFDPRSWDANGVGIIAGLHRPDHGPGHYVLECTACSASWVGVPGAACQWCRAHREHLWAHQRALLLEMPAERTEQALTAWGQRLRQAVDAKLITRSEAQRAWAKAVPHVA